MLWKMGNYLLNKKGIPNSIRKETKNRPFFLNNGVPSSLLKTENTKLFSNY